jgi:hypothetical protein
MRHVQWQQGHQRPISARKPQQQQHMVCPMFAECSTGPWPEGCCWSFKQGLGPLRRGLHKGTMLRCQVCNIKLVDAAPLPPCMVRAAASRPAHIIWETPFNNMWALSGKTQSGSHPISRLPLPTVAYVTLAHRGRLFAVIHTEA